MSNKGSGSGSVLLAAVLGIVIGGVGGFYFRFWNAPEPGGGRIIGGETATPMAGGGGPRGGMAMGPAGTGSELARMIRNLATIEKVQNRGLTADQAKELLPILQQLSDAETLPEAEAGAKLAAIGAILTDQQKEALAALQPVRGGGRSGGAGGSGSGATAPSQPQAGTLMPPPGGGPSGGTGGGGGGMMGGGDPDRPFASERNRTALQDLIALAQAVAK